ncbi:IS3 family transposase [Lacticaseibacillus pantheris]|uniref:IS3 family transposase n=1 Tax=Lacticaseibacillus pantheris TaxID=171523 RepID=UPI000A4AEE18|nr:IS3 family transposase [Lacticaseibacillus pantheris]
MINQESVQQRLKRLEKENLSLRIQNDALKKIGSLEKATKRQISEVIIALRAKYKLVDLIQALPISMSVFQYWQQRLSQPDPDEEIKARISLVFNAHNGNYGILRVTPEVRAMYVSEGRQAPNHKRIQRLMVEMDMHCQKYGKRTRKYDSSKGPSGKKAKNKLNRRFSADRPLQKLVCDVTELQATMVIRSIWRLSRTSTAPESWSGNSRRGRH